MITYTQGTTRITVSRTLLLPSQALPQQERGTIWMWLRPKGSSRTGSGKVSTPADSSSSSWQPCST